MSPRLAIAVACGLASLWSAQAVSAEPAQKPAALAQPGLYGGAAPFVSVTLTQCLTSVPQSERSAAFLAEMTAVAHSVRMAVRIEIQQRAPGDVSFHTLTAPGLGAWHESVAGVTTYRYLDRVTGLSAPGSYRAVAHFRWLGGGNHQIHQQERHSSSCLVPAG